jgi:hypothetical protein
MSVSVLRIIGVREIEEIPGCDGWKSWRIDKTDSEKKTQEEIER